MTAKAKAKTDKKPRQETSGKDRQNQLDRELADTFPASDPLSVTHPSIKSGAPEREPSSRKKRRNGKVVGAQFTCFEFGAVGPDSSPSCRGSPVCHSMAVRLKFGRPGSLRKAAAIEPFPSALLGTLNEVTRGREIVWRHVERTERRHNANVDLVREPLDIMDESPLGRQRYCMQDPGDRPFWKLFQGASIASWKHDDP